MTTAADVDIAAIPRRKTRNTDGPQAQERAILDAASAEFVAIGVRRASVDAIATAAGVSRSTLYRRFPTKEALLVAVAVDLYEVGMDVLESSIAGLSPKDAVAQAFATGAELVQTHPLMHRLVLEDFEMRGITSASMSAMFIDSICRRSIRALRSVGAVRDDVELGEVVEIMVRVVISQLEVPDPDERRQNPEYARAFAMRHFAPMVW